MTFKIKRTHERPNATDGLGKGSWAVAMDSGKSSKEMHSVYASPGAVAQFKKLGHFANGAVLTNTTSTDYHKACWSCRVPAKATDWIYLQGYSPLKN